MELTSTKEGEHVNSVLFDEFPILVDRVLAEKIGLNEAIVIQQLHYWIIQNKRQNKNYFDEKYWTFNTLKKWHVDTFYFWSLDTVKRTFKKLEEDNLIIVGNYNKKGYDRTKWYTINYEKLTSKCCNNSIVQNALLNSADCTNAIVQNAPMESGKMPYTIPDTTQRLNTETTYISTTQSSAVVDTNTELIESKTHLKLSKNMKKIAHSWEKERLSKAIELFNCKNGKYFSLLEKIYLDNGNFSKNTSNSIGSNNKNYTSTNKFANFDQPFLNYSEDELNKIIAKSQREKFDN